MSAPVSSAPTPSTSADTRATARSCVATASRTSRRKLDPSVRAAQARSGSTGATTVTVPNGDARSPTATLAGPDAVSRVFSQAGSGTSPGARTVSRSPLTADSVCESHAVSGRVSVRSRGAADETRTGPAGTDPPTTRISRSAAPCWARSAPRVASRSASSPRCRTTTVKRGVASSCATVTPLSPGGLVAPGAAMLATSARARRAHPQRWSTTRAAACPSWCELYVALNRASSPA